MLVTYCVGIVSAVVKSEESKGPSDSNGFSGCLSKLGELISGAAHFCVGHNEVTLGAEAAAAENKLTIPLPDRIAGYGVATKVVLIAVDILLAAAAGFFAIEASPLFISCWFLGLFAPALAIALPLISSFCPGFLLKETKIKAQNNTKNLEDNTENLETENVFQSPNFLRETEIKAQNDTKNLENLETKNVFQPPNFKPEQKFKNPINFGELQAMMTQEEIAPDGKISDNDNDRRLVGSIVGASNGSKEPWMDGYIDINAIDSYKDLWKITSNWTMFGQFAASIDQASIYRSIWLAAHFGNSNNPVLIAIKRHNDMFQARICPTYKVYSDKFLMPNLGNDVCYVCTGNEETVNRIREACVSKCPAAIFVENIYNESEIGTIRIHEKVGSDPAEETITWQAEGKPANT